MPESYIGRGKILTVQEDGEWVIVSFEGETPQMRLPKIMFEAIKSAEPVDDTGLRDKRVMVVLQEIVKTYLKYDLKLKEIDVVQSYASNFINDKLSHASAKLWRGTMSNPLDEATFHPQRTLDERTIGDLDRLLESQKKNA